VAKTADTSVTLRFKERAWRFNTANSAVAGSLTLFPTLSIGNFSAMNSYETTGGEDQRYFIQTAYAGMESCRRRQAL